MLLSMYLSGFFSVICVSCVHIHSYTATSPADDQQMTCGTFRVQKSFLLATHNAFSIFTWMLGIDVENSSGEALTVLDRAVNSIQSQYCMPCVRYFAAGYGKRQSECHCPQLNTFHCMLMPLLSVQQHRRPWEAMLATLEASGRRHGTRAEYRTSYCICLYTCNPWLKCHVQNEICPYIAD